MLRVPWARVRSRRSWGAGPVKAQRHQLGLRSVPVVHHTAGSYGLTSRSTIAQEQRVLREIQASHRARGFTDIGYSEIVFPSGRVYNGRGFYRVPAAAANANAGHFHLSLIGNFEAGDMPTGKQLKALRSRTRAFRRRSGSKRHAIGHYQANRIAVTPHPLNQTACPGWRLKPYVRRLP